MQGLNEVIRGMCPSDGDELEIVKTLEGRGRADLLTVGSNNLSLGQAEHRRVEAVSADIRPGGMQLLAHDRTLVILQQSE